MVKGLKMDNNSMQSTQRNKKNEEAKANITQVAETYVNTKTHDQIYQWSKDYNITWQQIFQLDAEFFSLITLEN